MHTNMDGRPISPPETTRAKQGGRTSELELRNPNILEGKWIEAVYAFAATVWAHVYDPLA